MMKKVILKKKVSIFLNEYEKYRKLSNFEKKSIKRSIIVAIASQLFYIYHLYLYAWENQDEFFIYYRNKFLRHLRNLVEGNIYG